MHQETECPCQGYISRVQTFALPLLILICTLVFGYSSFVFYARVHAKLLKLRPTLCNPMDCSPPGSSVHGILQARILLSCSPAGDLPDPGIEPTSPVAPALQMESLLLSHPGNPLSFISYSKLCNKEAGNVEIKVVCTYEQHLFCARENKAEQSLQTLFKRESCFFFPSMLNTLLLVIRYGAVFFPIPSNSLIPSRHQLDGRESE